MTVARLARAALLLGGGVVALALAGWGLAALAGALWPWTSTGVDREVAELAAARRTGTGRRLAEAVTWLADIRVVGTVIVAVGALAARRGRWDVLLLPAVAVGGGLAVSVAVKYAVARLRPPPELLPVDAFGPAFPSGHTIRAVAAYATLAWLVSRATTRRAVTVPLWVLAAVLPLLVGGARVYLGAHWPTDVLGGYALATAWTLLVIGALPRLLPAVAAPPEGERGTHVGG